MGSLSGLQRGLVTFYRAFGGYRFHIALMTALSIVSGLLEGIGINAIIPLFSFISGGGTPSDSISAFIARLFGYFHLRYDARTLLVFIVFLFLLKAVFVILSQYVTAGVVADFERRTRGKLLAGTFAAHWPFLSSQKVGHLDQTLTTDVAGSSAALSYFSSAILVTANLVIYTALVMNLSPTIGGLAALAGLFIFMGFRPLLHKTRAVSALMVAQFKNIAHFASEHLLGSKILKALRVETAALERGEALFDEMKQLTVRIAFLRNVVPTLLQLVGVFFIVGLFVFLYKTATFHFASFAVIVYALNKVFGNLQFVQTNLHAMSMQLPFVSSVLCYAKEAEDAREADVGKESFSFKNELRFDRVSFAYTSESRLALADISFAVKRGEIVGIIGPSGAGKTTLVDVLLRLISPARGKISLDHIDVNAIQLDEWRSKVGYVAQDIFLLNGTIAENIRFYDDSVTKESMRSAAKMANIYDFIVSQSKQWETPVGERGLSLSGGQRQRIALARALARAPELLILDEATSALDHESELLIQQSIASLKGVMSIIIIAHRLSTLSIADRLVVLEGGRVTETGSPATLLKDKGSYFSKAYHLRT